MKNLRRKGKFSTTRETRGRFNIGKPIRKRPQEVNTRKTIGHWEADTVVSGKEKSKTCFVTLAERTLRVYLVIKVPNRTEKVVTKAIIDALRKYPSRSVKTITCDRGKEFAGYKKIEEKLQVGMYFADPYRSWQRGTNENSNGLLREFYPKGMNLSTVNEKDLKEKVDLINSRPSKCIDYQIPKVLFY
jgi:IS30 family transposase